MVEVNQKFVLLEMIRMLMFEKSQLLGKEFTISPRAISATIYGVYCTSCRSPDKSAKLKIIFLVSQPKHMLWVLKRTVSMRRFF